MTALAAGDRRARSARPGAPGTRRRRFSIGVEMALVAGWCVLGLRLLGGWFRHVEVAGACGLLRAIGQTRVSGALGDAFVVAGPDARPLVAQLTPACSALPSLLALSALAGAVLRRRRASTVAAFLLAGCCVLVANQVRLALSLLAGRYFGAHGLVLFHDWIGGVFNFAYTIAGLLLMIWLSLLRAERAEQDRWGNHTANRPADWARPGLGYRAGQVDRPGGSRRTVTGLLHRYLLPTGVSRRLAARRERGRVDYRLGHLPPPPRAAAVADLAAAGLGVHTATLLAVAANETDVGVLDALADAVAAQQWEPLSHRQVAALRLWARAWLMRSPVVAPDPSQVDRTVGGGQPASGPLVAVTGAGGPAGVAVIRALRAAGHPVLALDASPDAAGLRLATGRAVLPRADSARFGAAVLDAVEAHRPAALISTVVEEYPALSGLTDRLAALGCRTWLPDLAAAETCADKVAFAAAMRAAGVAHPPTATALAEARALPGPWIVKPARGRGSRGVVRVDTAAELGWAVGTVADPIVQTRLSSREFTADVLVARDGTVLTCVPRWRAETKAGISVKGSTFDSAAVTGVVTDTLRAVGLTGPANVQGFVDDAGAVTVVEVNPRFSGGLPLTLAAGADVVGTYLTGILEPAAALPRLTFRPGVHMTRHLAEVFWEAGGTDEADGTGGTGGAR